ncbi:MAG: flagellar export protein FliJ [Armatimonadota bacterium]|nr:flagellar export protein FliJ [Armatimonadota bacterium]
MPDFEFSLQSALDLRRHEEDVAQRRLAQAQRIADGIRAQLRETQGRHDDIVAALSDSGIDGSGPIVGRLQHAHRCLASFRHAISRLRERLEQAQRLCRGRRAELLAASQAREALERLAERQEADHRRELARREQRELDEAAIARHHRQQATPGVADPGVAAA